VGVLRRDLAAGWAALPHAHQPDRVEAPACQRVKFFVRHVAESDSLAGALAQAVEPRPGVDLVNQRIRPPRPYCHHAVLACIGLKLEVSGTGGRCPPAKTKRSAPLQQRAPCSTRVFDYEATEASSLVAWISASRSASQRSQLIAAAVPCPTEVAT